MCGIAGIFSFNQKAEKSSLQKMTDSLSHRGPDGEGLWLNPNEKIALGHRRLSIIDLSELGHQPMHFADNRFTITFNGEIYNYLEIRKDLEKEGLNFKTNTDTEVLLALYARKKEKALNELDGMFAFTIWDNQEETLFCARDRFGEKPFYFHKNNNIFAFASEMKALLAIGISPKQNSKKVYNYLLYATLEDPFNKDTTFYEEINQLEPANYLIIGNDGKIKKEKYWDIDLNKTSQLNQSDSIEKFSSLFSQSITKRLRSDVPVGSSLSGGLDSSSIVMLIDKLKKDGTIQKTFSARFKDFSRDEGKFMQMVIDKTKVDPYFVFPTVDSVMQNLSLISKHQEEPMGSASVLIQYEVMKLAKQNGIKVLLDGQGADEIMGGYTIFWQTYFNQLYRSNKKRYHFEKEKYLNVHQKLPFTNNIEFKWKAFHNPSLNLTSKLQRYFISPKSDYFLGIHPELVNEFKHIPNPIIKPTNLKEHLLFSLKGRGLSELLRYADRNSMANSIEVRLPFLNHELVEFLFELPDHLLLNEGWTKYILRKSMDGILPDEITWRKDKIGYEPPQEEWLKSSYFQELAAESISYLKKENIIQKENKQLTWNYISLFIFNKGL
ncbi:MAG: asnB [Bacteroidetes bacterium]|jgi:asparagine synthase (glutamine-hydrolysing)|nr:asnB [Bacteroidota bacterium]